MELAISIFAAVIALLSLGWQAFEWHRSGARTKITGAIVQHDRHPAAFVIHLVNSGRGSAQIVEVLLVAENGTGSFNPKQYALGGAPRMPLQLEAGHSIDLSYAASRMTKALAHHDMTSLPHYLSVLLGDGTVHRSKGTIVFPPSLIRDDDTPIEHASHVVHVVASMNKKSRRRRS